MGYGFVRACVELWTVRGVGLWVRLIKRGGTWTWGRLIFVSERRVSQSCIVLRTTRHRRWGRKSLSFSWFPSSVSSSFYYLLVRRRKPIGYEEGGKVTIPLLSPTSSRKITSSATTGGGNVWIRHLFLPGICRSLFLVGGACFEPIGDSGARLDFMTVV